MSREKITFNELLKALKDSATPLAPRYLYRFSDMPDEEIQQLEQSWTAIPAWRRQALLEDIEDLGLSDDLLSFEALACLAVKDPEPSVRLPAVRTLWEFDSRSLVSVYLRLLKKDTDEQVRAAAATGLGSFILAGETESIPRALQTEIERELLKAYESDPSTTVRCQVLEALGYSENEKIATLISQAFASNAVEWKASALAAMGHSADSIWYPQVKQALESHQLQISTAAARAAGELEMADTAPRLIELLEEDDLDLRQAAIWSLSQIGGAGVRQALEKLASQTQDEEEVSFIEEALEELAFNEDDSFLSLFNLDEEDGEGDEEEDEDAGAAKRSRPARK